MVKLHRFVLLGTLLLGLGAAPALADNDRNRGDRHDFRRGHDNVWDMSRNRGGSTDIYRSGNRDTNIWPHARERNRDRHDWNRDRNSWNRDRNDWNRGFGQRFDRADRNDDGQLSRRELQRLWGNDRRPHHSYSNRSYRGRDNDWSRGDRRDRDRDWRDGRDWRQGNVWQQR